MLGFRSRSTACHTDAAVEVGAGDVPCMGESGEKSDERAASGAGAARRLDKSGVRFQSNWPLGAHDGRPCSPEIVAGVVIMSASHIIAAPSRLVVSGRPLSFRHMTRATSIGLVSGTWTEKQQGRDNLGKVSCDMPGKVRPKFRTARGTRKSSTYQRFARRQMRSGDGPRASENSSRA